MNASLSRILYYVFYVLYYVVMVAQYALIAQAIMSWFVSPMNRFYIFVRKITEPFVTPFRPLEAKISKGRIPIALSPLFAYVALLLLQRLIVFAMQLCLR